MTVCPGEKAKIDMNQRLQNTVFLQPSEGSRGCLDRRSSGRGGGKENTRWVITSAWLTAIHLLSRDKSLLSLVRPGLKYFCSDKVQKEIVKISTCSSKLNFCPHATKQRI